MAGSNPDRHQDSAASEPEQVSATDLPAPPERSKSLIFKDFFLCASELRSCPCSTSNFGTVQHVFRPSWWSWLRAAHGSPDSSPHGRSAPGSPGLGPPPQRIPSGQRPQRHLVLAPDRACRTAAATPRTAQRAAPLHTNCAPMPCIGKSGGAASYGAFGSRCSPEQQLMAA